MRILLLKLFFGFLMLFTCSSGFLFAMMEDESGSLTSSENKQTVGSLPKQDMSVIGDSHEPELGDIEEWKSVHRYLSKLIRRSGTQHKSSGYGSESGNPIETDSDKIDGSTCFICSGSRNEHTTIKVGKNGHDKLFTQPQEQDEKKDYESLGGQSYIFFYRDYVAKMSRPEGLGYLLREANTLDNIDSPYILSMSKCCLDYHGQNIMLFSERFDSDGFDKDYRHISHQDIKLILQSGLEGLKYLREQGVLHLDVRGVNFLWKRNKEKALTRVCLGDLGKAQVLGCPTCPERAWGSGEAEHHLPWEVRCDKPDEKSDIWSIGVYIVETIVDGYSQIFISAIEKFEEQFVKKWESEPDAAEYGEKLMQYKVIRDKKGYTPFQELCAYTLWDHDLLFETIKDHPDLCKVDCLKQYWPTICSMVKGNTADRPSANDTLAELNPWLEGKSDCFTCITQHVSKQFSRTVIVGD